MGCRDVACGLGSTPAIPILVYHPYRCSVPVLIYSYSIIRVFFAVNGYCVFFKIKLHVRGFNLCYTLL